MSITNDDLLLIRQLLEQTMDEKLHPFHECLTTCAGRANQILEQLMNFGLDLVLILLQH